MLFAPWNDAVLDGAFLQMIQHLVAGDRALVRDLCHSGKIVGVEIADAPGADLAGGFQFLEGGDRLDERRLAAPVQQIAIEVVGAETLQRTLARLDGAPLRSVAWQHLGNQEHVVAPALDGIGHDQFGVVIHLGSVDMGHAKVEAVTQRRRRGGAIAAVDVPGALPDDGDVGAVAEFLLPHARLRWPCVRYSATGRRV